MLTSSVLKGVFSVSSLDVESRYYQATQALEYAQNMDDICWAQGELKAIWAYKNAQTLLLICDEMISRNTYKYEKFKAMAKWNAVLLPKVGTTIDKVLLSQLYKKVGDTVTAAEPLFAYETDKAIFDHNAPISGKVVKILYSEGDTVPCLSPVCYIEP